jgi:hypothetical protein
VVVSRWFVFSNEDYYPYVAERDIEADTPEQAVERAGFVWDERPRDYEVFVAPADAVTVFPPEEEP